MICPDRAEDPGCKSTTTLIGALCQMFSQCHKDSRKLKVDSIQADLRAPLPCSLAFPRASRKAHP